MANVYQNTTNGLGMLKNFYEGPIVSQFNDDMPAMRTFEKDKKSWSGLQVVRPIKVRRNGGIGATSDGGNLPAIGQQGTVQAIIAAKLNYLRFGITGPMIKSSQSDIGSFVRAAAYNLEQGYIDLKNDLNRQFSYNGNPWLAKLASAAVATSSVSISGRETGEAALKFLDADMVVDIVSSAGVVKASAVTISSTSGTPSATTATLVLNSAVTASSGDYVIRSGSYGNEIQGTLTAEDGNTTTIYNVDRSTYQAYQGNVIDNGGDQLSIDDMQTTYDEGQRRGAGEYTAILTDFTSRRFYQKLLTADKRYSNTIKGDGGFADKSKSYLEFNGVAIVADKDAPPLMQFIDKNSFVNYVLCEMEFADETGKMFIAQPEKDQLEARVRFFANMFNEKPSASAVLKTYVSP
jgi:hypothetical protein